MFRRIRCRWQFFLWLSGLLSPCLPPAHGQQLPEATLLHATMPESWHRLTLREVRPDDFLAAVRLTPGAQRPVRKLRLDVGPLLGDVIGFLRDMGLPLRRSHDPSGTAALGVAASFQVQADAPALSFHVADRCPDPLNAFYAGGRGLSWALVWPIHRFTLRLEGGDDSEFGSYAIAGAQWNHHRRPLAIGLGVPVRLKNAEGNVGLILQVRTKLW